VSILFQNVFGKETVPNWPKPLSVRFLDDALPLGGDVRVAGISLALLKEYVPDTLATRVGFPFRSHVRRDLKPAAFQGSVRLIELARYSARGLPTLGAAAFLSAQPSLLPLQFGYFLRRFVISLDGANIQGPVQFVG
jgi:hypothetical protein